VACRGPLASDCTACWAGQSLNIEKNWDPKKTPYPHGICDSLCYIGYFKQTQLTGKEITDMEKFWNVETGWLCMPCHKTCYDCSGPSETHCFDCKSPDTVFKLNKAPKRVLEEKRTLNEERVMMNEITGTCLNCTLVESYSQNPEICINSKEVSIKKNDRPLDGFSAVTFKIGMGSNNSSVTSKLSTIKWDEIF
jgi:hypothetical protein